MLFDKGLQFGIDLENFEQDEPMRPQIDNGDLRSLATSDVFAPSSLTTIEDTNDGSITNFNTNGNEWHEQEATDHISVITSTTTTLPTIGNAVGVTHEADSPHSPHNIWQNQGDPETPTLATRNHVTYEWRIGDWSPCSEKLGNAGGAGFRVSVAQLVIQYFWQCAAVYPTLVYTYLVGGQVSVEALWHRELCNQLLKGKLKLSTFENYILLTKCLSLHISKY